MSRAAAPAASHPQSLPVSWRFPVSIGTADLSAQELADLERNDVLIFEGALTVLLPHRFDRGWSAAAVQSGTDGSEVSNFERLRIDKYFEREFLNTEGAQGESPRESDPKLDLNLLPVRLHVILTEKELTLQEAAGLTSGAILDLDCDKSGIVSLAANGKVLGEGRLVEVEGRLGVRIVSWREA
jgi:type III secretion protein Q